MRYVVGQREGRPFIVCAACGFTSPNANDVRERYCPRCHVFHDEEERADRLLAELEQRDPAAAARLRAVRAGKRGA